MVLAGIAHDHIIHMRLEILMILESFFQIILMNYGLDCMMIVFIDGKPTIGQKVTQLTKVWFSCPDLKPKNASAGSAQE